MHERDSHQIQMDLARYAGLHRRIESSSRVYNLPPVPIQGPLRLEACSYLHEEEAEGEEPEENLCKHAQTRAW